MELKDTIELMESDDYRSRFLAEYWQTRIRYAKLHTMLIKYKAGTLDFTPNCNIETLSAQEDAMDQYLFTLEVRAEKEGIDLVW